MPIKLHCNRCHALIKELTPSEAARLKGDEICIQCRDLGRETLDKLNAECGRLTKDFQVRHNKAVVQLEEAIRKFFDE